MSTQHTTCNKYIGKMKQYPVDSRDAGGDNLSVIPAYAGVHYGKEPTERSGTNLGLTLGESLIEFVKWSFGCRVTDQVGVQPMPTRTKLELISSPPPLLEGWSWRKGFSMKANRDVLDKVARNADLTDVPPEGETA
jgi:hypothetical protein